MSKKNLLRSTLELSFGILINKPIGLLRDILQMRYFGLSMLGDAYVIAWRIPNVLRRVFSEGLMTSILLPYLVQIKAEETEQVLNEVVTAISIFMQIIVIAFCFLVSFFSKNIIVFLSPGAPERIVFATEMLQILIFFTLLTSFSSILGVAVQLKKKFYIGPVSQFFLNIFFCIELFFGIKYTLSYRTISLMISLNSILVFFIHFIFFYKNNFYFFFPSKKSILKSVFFLKKFFIGFFSSLLLEINMFAGLSFTSYLSVGLLSLFEYINTLIRLPLQICGSALATTLQGDIGESIYKKDYKTVEKKIFFIFILFFLVAFLTSMSIFIFGKKFFALFFYLVRVDLDYISLASELFFLFSFLIFPALANKILLTVFYSFHSVSLTTIINFFLSLFSNFFLWSFIKQYGIFVLVFTIVFIEIIRFFIFILLLYFFYNISFFKEQTTIEIVRNIIITFFLFLFLFYCFFFSLSFFLKIDFFLQEEVYKLSSFFIACFCMRTKIKKISFLIKKNY